MRSLWGIILAAFVAAGLLSACEAKAEIASTDVIGREFSVYVPVLLAPSSYDAITREFTVYVPVLSAPIANDVTSREFSVYVPALDSPVVTDTVSREFSIYVPPSPPVRVTDAFSREFSVYVPALQTPTHGDAISREFSVLVNDPPRVELTNAYPPNGLFCSSCVEFSWVGASVTSSSDALLYSYRIDSAAWSEYLPATNVKITLTDGQHKFEVMAMDAYGQVSSSNASCTFVVDASSPALNNVSVIPCGARALITWNTDEPANSLVEYGAESSYGKNSSLSSELVTQHLVVLTELVPGATYHYRVISSDACGHENLSPDASFVMPQDDTPPYTYIESGPAEDGTSCDENPKLCWKAQDNITPPEECQYSYCIDDDSWTDWSADLCAQLTGLSEGLHKFQVKSRDASGNEDPDSAVRNFTVALTPPVISGISVESHDTAVTIRFDSSERLDAYIDYGNDANYGSTVQPVVYSDGSYAFVLEGLSPLTEYHFRVRMNNGCSETASDDHTFTTTDTLKPNLVLTSVEMTPSVSSGQSVQVTWTVKNTGHGDATGQWMDGLYVSDDDELDASDTPLGVFAMGNIVSGGSYNLTGTITLPNKDIGTYYLLVKTDSEDCIDETNNDDNIRAELLEFTRAANLIAAPDKISISIAPGQTYTGRINLSNMGSSVLEPITSVVDNKPANLDIQLSSPTSLLGAQTSDVDFTVSALDDSIQHSTSLITFAGPDEQKATVLLDVTIKPLKPKLTVEPNLLECGMVRGEQTIVEFEIENTGSVAADSVRIMLPDADWISLLTPAGIGAINPDGKKKVSLALKPNVSLPLGTYSGKLVANASNTSIVIPYSFVCASDGKGDLRIVAEDEFTYFGKNSPCVANAKIVLRKAKDNTVVAEGVTDLSGVFNVKALTEGYYNLEVCAEKHGTAKLVVEVVAGEEHEAHAFVPRQSVTYTWTVESVDQQDNYKLNLNATFEANVPAPVITINPSYLDLTTLNYDDSGKAVVSYTITNHGLIAANAGEFRFGYNSAYSLKPAITELGTLNALSSVAIPVTVTKPGYSVTSSLHLLGDGMGSCASESRYNGSYECGGARAVSAKAFVDGQCGGSRSYPPSDDPCIDNSSDRNTQDDSSQTCDSSTPSSTHTGNSSGSASPCGCPKTEEEQPISIYYDHIDDQGREKPQTLKCPADPGKLYVALNQKFKLSAGDNVKPGTYTWYYNGTRISGGSSTELTICKEGTYIYELRYQDESDCPKSYKGKVTIEASTPSIDVTLTYAWHPALDSLVWNLQPLFDSASQLFLSDDDGPGDGGDLDDVSLNVRFHLSMANPFVFPDEYASSDYLDITDLEKKGKPLLHDPFANIKLIRKLPGMVGGYGSIGDYNMLLCYASYDVIAAHEWGHTCGIIGDYDISGRIMNGLCAKTNNEISLDERKTILEHFAN